MFVGEQSRLFDTCAVLVNPHKRSSLMTTHNSPTLFVTDLTSDTVAKNNAQRKPDIWCKQ